MRKLIVLLFITWVSFGFAQEKKKIDFSVNTLKYSMNSIKELRNFNWKNLEKIASFNGKGTKVRLEFTLDVPKTKEQSKLMYTYAVEGKSEDINDLITSAKKGLNGIKSVSKDKIKIDLR